MLNFTLATAFIFYIAATSWSSCSLVFCSKVVLRLALVHSKYTGNREITVISIRRWMKSLLLSPPPSSPPTVCRKRRSLKTILSNLNCSENFWKIHRKKSMAFTSASNSKKDSPYRCFLGNFPNIFQNSYFYKALLSSCFCISLYYLVFQAITLWQIWVEMY